MASCPSLPPLRHVIDWHNMGVPLGTTSDEAAQMFDALLYQIYGNYESPHFGGRLGTFQKMYAADPQFTFSQIFSLKLNTATKLKELAPFMPTTEDLCVQLKGKVAHVNEWERAHIEAAIAKARGLESKAARIWTDCIALVPYDLLAGWQILDYGLLYGREDLFKSVYGIMVDQTAKADPYHGFLKSLFAFGLEEAGHYEEAKKPLTESLEHTPWDSWAYHTHAHLYDALGEPREGRKHLRGNRPYWVLENNSCFLECHNYWHEALFSWELGEMEDVLDVLDGDLMPFITQRPTPEWNMYSIIDIVALLMRLEIEEMLPRNTLQKRWDLVCDYLCGCDVFGDIGSTGVPFADLHILMALVAGRRPERFSDYLTTLRQQCLAVEEHLTSHCRSERNGDEEDEEETDFVRVHRVIFQPLVSAIEAFFKGDYETSAEILYPKRNDILQLGGSNAQRDLYTLLLCHCLGRTGTRKNLGRLRLILMERMAARATDKSGSGFRTHSAYLAHHELKELAGSSVN